MASIKYIDLPLFPDMDYSYAASLEDSSYLLRITYNQTMQLYTIAISDVDLNMLISGVGLVPNYPILLDYVIEGLTGSFILAPNTDKPIEFYKIYPDQIHKYYTLSYVYAVPD